MAARHVGWIGCTLAALLLQGCMSAPPAPPPDDSYTHDLPDDWQQRRAELEAFDTWSLQGKIAVRHDDGTDSGLIRHWDQAGSQFSMEVSSSFMGMGTTRLEGSPHFLVVTDPSGEQYMSEDPNALIHETLRWELPMEALAYWVRGLPDPSAEYELFFNPEGQISYLRQHNWEVHYEGHEPLDELPELPRRMTATHDDARVRLVITQWENTGS